MADDSREAAERALANFSSWLDEVSPRHRALRTPVRLEEDAPALIRQLWGHTGWSDVMGARPERAYTDRAAEKRILGWFSSSMTRESWNVATPDEALRAVRARLPEKSRFVNSPTRNSAVVFTDETSGCDDPPVWLMDRDGNPRRLPHSYVQQLIWGICGTIGEDRGRSYEGPPVPGEQPFAPLFPWLWTIHDGVWALGERAVDPNGNPATTQQPARILCRSSIEYFDYVMGLPDETAEHFFGALDGDMYLAVDDPNELDPEDPEVPGYRSVTANRGMVELDGVRFWVSKHSSHSSCAFIHVPRGQYGAAQTVLREREIEVYEQDYRSAIESLYADGTAVAGVAR